MSDLFYSSCPIARRTSETFVEWTTIGGERRRFEFERDVIWLQESEAVLRFVHGGQELKRESTHTDFYGYLTAGQGLNDDARRAAATYSVTPESSLAIEIVSLVVQRPVIETEVSRKYNLTKPGGHKSQWAYLPDAWRVEAKEDGETVYPRLARVELAEEVVWSSRHSEEGNQALLSDFRSRWSAVERPIVAVAG